MKKNIAKVAVVLVGLLSLPAFAQSQPMASGSFLRDGTYTCIAGFRTMLTLGEMMLSGTSYRFHPPHGPDTTGTFTPVAAGIAWHGDVGVIKNNEIVASNRDQGSSNDDFWLTFASDLTRGEKVNLNCKL